MNSHELNVRINFMIYGIHLSPLTIYGPAPTIGRQCIGVCTQPKDQMPYVTIYLFERGIM